MNRSLWVGRKRREKNSLNSLTSSGSNFHHGPRPFGDPSLIVRIFPLGFVTFRALRISSHALSLLCAVLSWKMAEWGSRELGTGKERKSESEEAKWEVDRGLATSSPHTDEVSSPRKAPHGPRLCNFEVSKAPQPKVRRVKKYPRVSFSKLLHISSTARQQQPLYWKMVEVLQVCSPHAAPRCSLVSYF